MDPSTQTAQGMQPQKRFDQSNRSQPPATTDQTQQAQPVQQPPQQQKKPTSISVNIESGPAVISQESPGGDEEDEIQPAKQETQTQIVQKQVSVAEVQEVSIQPSVPEVSVENTEVENIVEASADSEKPEISEEEKDAGVTHSGPGVIVVEQSQPERITKIPSYASAKEEEKKTQLHDSKHWLMAVVMYVWRKIKTKAEGE